MKYARRLVTFLLILTMSCPVFADSVSPNPPAKSEMRGLWVASVVNIDYPSKPTTDPETLKSEAIRILDYAKDTGFNAVFLQVRPTADALYKSQYYPWSRYLTGTQGVAPGGDFDPLAFWISEAHKRGLQLHAWVNPYRITKKAAGDPSDISATLSSDNPAVLHPDWVLLGSDGNLYFDPGIPEARQYIVLGIIELINNYAVDGIHFDDYFYPDTKFNDQTTYQKYNTSGLSLDDWRRENCNALIRDVSTLIKLSGKNISFGISPFGIWRNKSSSPLGSDTKGLEGYSAYYSDALAWISEGMIDYIAPQIYWNIGYSVADYSKLLTWWRQAVAGTSVELYIGQAAYKAGNRDPSSPWYGVSELARQLDLNQKSPGVAGSIFYNYKSLAENPALSAEIKAVFERRDGKTATVPVGIGRPSENIRTSFSSFYLTGASDPNKPLYLNGQLVTDRSSQGYYGILAPLSEGANSFTFSQEASYATVSIYREASSSAPGKMSKAEITPSSVFPQSPEMRAPGEKITLSCKAPIGSKVTVKINGKTYTMSPATTKSPGSGIYPTTFSYAYTIPSFTGTARNVDLGAPVYSMNYRGSVKIQKAPASVTTIMKGSPYYAEVTGPVIDTYAAPVSGNGAAYELAKGMTDSVTGMTGSYARLSSGQWAFKSQVKIYTSKSKLQPTVKKTEYVIGDKWDSFMLGISSPAAGIASFDGTTLQLNVSAAVSASQPVLPANSLFSSVKVTNNGNGTQYALTVRQNTSIDGYCVDKTDSGLVLNIKRHVVVQNGALPLTGITILVDPGHGGSETGTTGPLGMKYPEKDINLQLSLKLKTELEALGAKVLTTRTADTYVSLTDRLAASRILKPDMFVSVHSNAMEDNVDISKVDGFSVWYREALAKPISDSVYDFVTNILARNEKGVNKANFYVTTGTWTPSFLIETGFVPNPVEFEWLTNDNQQTQLAKVIAQAVAAYFSR